MRSSTSSEDSRLVRIVVPCVQTSLAEPDPYARGEGLAPRDYVQTRLPGPRCILELERAAQAPACFDRPARKATEP